MSEDAKPLSTRPQLLRITCILGFIYTSASIIWYALIASVFYVIKLAMPELFEKVSDKAGNQISELTFNNSINEMFDFIRYYLQHADFLTLIYSFLSILSFWGVYLLWKNKRKGLLLFSAAQFLIMFLPFLFYGFTTISVFTFLLTAILPVLFIIFFVIALRKFPESQKMTL